MYIPGYSELSDRDRILGLMRESSFATLVVGGSEIPEVVHLPLLIDQEDPLKLMGHVARANPIWRRFSGGTHAVAIFAGPHTYISPRWYESRPNVPTWNYAVVHAIGVPTVVTDPQVEVAHLRSIVSFFDPELATAQPESLEQSYVERMAKGVVTFQMFVDRIEAKHKMSQNKVDEDRHLVIATLADSEHEDRRKVAIWMSHASREGSDSGDELASPENPRHGTSEAAKTF